MSDAVASAREALIAQLLEDIDALITRLETVDQELRARIEVAVRDAAGQAFLRARLELEAVIDQQTDKLGTAGRHAAALIGQATRGEAAAITTRAVGRRRMSAREALWAGAFHGVISALMGSVGGASTAVVMLLAERWLR